MSHNDKIEMTDELLLRLVCENSVNGRILYPNRLAAQLISIAIEKKQRWEAAEPYLAANVYAIAEYVSCVTHTRIPEFEHILADKSTHALKTYREGIFGERLPDLEAYMVEHNLCVAFFQYICAVPARNILFEKLLTMYCATKPQDEWFYLFWEYHNLILTPIDDFTI